MSSCQKEKLLFALDIGTRSLIGILGTWDGSHFKVVDQEVLQHQKRAMIDGQIEDIEEVARMILKVKETLEGRQNVQLHNVHVAAAGRSLRTLKVRETLEINQESIIDLSHISELEKKALDQAIQIMEGDGEETLSYLCAGYSVVKYYLDDYPMNKLVGHSGRQLQADLIVTFLPEQVIESLQRATALAHLVIESMTLEPIAAMNAVIPEEMRLLNLALADVGAGTTDIAISNQGQIQAYTMADQAGDEITETIVQLCLVDFQEAEKIKLEASEGRDPLIFENVLGFTQQVPLAEILAGIRPAVERLAQVIGDKILEANGKSPAALFLVGGASQTPLLQKQLAAYLLMDEGRIAVGSKSYLKAFKTEPFTMEGPVYATPLGIALTAAKNHRPYSFQVQVNGKTINAHQQGPLPMTDVLRLAGYKARDIIAAPGKGLTYTINGIKKYVAGRPGQHSQIILNGKPVSILTLVNHQDVIQFVAASPGEDVFLTLDEVAKDIPLQAGVSRTFEVNGVLLSEEDRVRVQDEIIVRDDFLPSESCEDISKRKDDHGPEPTLDNEGRRKTSIVFNGQPLVLLHERGEPLLFIEVFNHLELDLDAKKGELVMLLNQRNASFVDPLMEGDVVEVFWDKEKDYLEEISENNESEARL